MLFYCTLDVLLELIQGFSGREAARQLFHFSPISSVLCFFFVDDDGIGFHLSPSHQSSSKNSSSVSPACLIVALNKPGFTR